jgi:hypothetical protein
MLSMQRQIREEFFPEMFMALENKRTASFCFHCLFIGKSVLNIYDELKMDFPEPETVERFKHGENMSEGKENTC